MKPIIGITPGYRKKADEAAFRYDLPVTYAGAISRAGGLPVMLAGAPGDAGEWARALDGLLLPGGGDIAPALYGAANLYSKNISEQRDAVEIAAARAFWEARKPVLGICRGIQVLCVALGGTLVQDIGRELALSHPYLPTPCHGITIRPGSILSSIVGVPGVANSTHHQALRDIPASLVPVAWSEDGRIVEAVEAADGRPALAVQWHPERMTEDAATARLFAWFVHRCGERSFMEENL